MNLEIVQRQLQTAHIGGDDILLVALVRELEKL